MRRIIKPGKDLNKKEHLIYTTTCPICGCVYEFEDEDCIRIERCLNGRVTVVCPHCNAEHKVRRSECESRTVDLKAVALALTTKAESCIVPNPCSTCPYKDENTLYSKCHSCTHGHVK